MFCRKLASTELRGKGHCEFLLPSDPIPPLFAGFSQWQYYKDVRGPSSSRYFSYGIIQECASP